MFLEQLLNKYPFEGNDHLADFWCGKGQVLVYAAYHKCKYITGYELDEERYDVAINNIRMF